MARPATGSARPAPAIPDLDVYDNVEVPLRYRGLPAAERRERVRRALGLVGRSGRLRHLSAQLSGGQQQRVWPSPASWPATLAVEPTADGRVRLRISDRGGGMSEEVLRMALLPFYSSKPGGTGLGLPFAREVIEAHGGRLRILRSAGGPDLGYNPPHLIGEYS